MLYLCATPIGNMEDITLRVLRVLSEVDAIYAEDTRHSAGLLSYYEIKKPLISCHEHNEAQRAAEIVDRLKNGDNIAYISDAGMPCVSDPGARIISACIDAGAEFTVVPGASASVTALALSGLDNERFLFCGFLPRSGKERRERLELVSNSPVTTIIYESPNRVYSSLCEIMQLTGGDRKAAVVREITKVFEEASRGTLSQLCEKYKDNAPKGECVIVLEAKTDNDVNEVDVDSMIDDCLNKGMKAKEAARYIADTLKISRNDIYKRILEKNIH